MTPCKRLMKKITNKSRTKKVFFKFAFKTAVSVSSRRSAGREFQADEPATEKARSAKLWGLVIVL